MTNASDVLVERLKAWGVDTVFGLPGGGINGVFEALRKNQDAIRLIHVRHEEAAAFMACAYAKFTGRLGACIATLSTRGVVHITIPVDVQVQEIKKGRSERNPIHHTSAVFAYFEQLPAGIELEHAADILNRGEKGNPRIS